jgi:formylglycine-generating enzyme required for sulfatase activity/serine/threonine protein kinase
MSTEDPLALVGTTVSEKYEIESVVGEGGFAIVYRARHTVWNRPVAIKVFRALGGLSPERRKELVDGFIQEGRLLAELSERSAAICQARDVDSIRMADGREMPFMVLEWLEGRSIEQVLEEEKQRRIPPLSPEAAVRLLEPAAEALALAHRKGIVHRDVKPANIFVLGDPRGEFTIKLLDFGIAKVVADAQRIDGGFAKTQGVVSSFTPAYGAPEQYSRALGPTGPWTDVFALGLIFTELTTHAAPLCGDDVNQLAFSSMDLHRRPTPRTLGAVVPDGVETVMLRALAVAPAERFQSMSEFWEALRGVLALEPTRLSSVGSTPSLGATGPRRPADPQVTGPPDVPRENQLTALPLVRRRDAAEAPRGSSRALVAGAAAVALVGVVALVARSLAARGKDPATPASTASSVAPAPIVSDKPALVSCPEGMTKIPGGKFFMGSDDRKDEADERPAHQVILSPYCMDTTEVTVDQYKACSDHGDCKRAPRENEWEKIDAAAHKLYDPLCNIREPETRGRHPVNCIDWDLASAFCKATGKRLPTEAEWEFATRGSDGRRYPWGDEAPTSGTFLNACGKECVAWGRKHPDPDNPLSAMYTVDDGFATTAPVGSFPKGASPFGLQDVVGNVWEWVSDWYAPYTAETVTDPHGPDAGTERVLRGGSWNGSDVAWVRPTYRFKTTPTLRSHGIGMRCAKSLSAR